MELAPGFRRLMAERLTPERLTSVAVTRHPESIIPAGNFPVSGFLLSDVVTLRVSGTDLQVRVRDMMCKGANAAGPRAKVQK